MTNASAALVWSFIGLAVVVGLTFVAAVYRASTPRAAIMAAVASAAWFGATYAMAAAGKLSFATRPPTMFVLFAAIAAIAIGVGRSRFGAQLATGIPLAALVGFQGFRFPLELMLHQAYVEGLNPVQMSFSGFNFDILSGISAIVVALVLVWKPRLLVVVRIWNAAGIVLLVNILTIAILSAPTPIRLFRNEPPNVWVTHAPWVWLPAVYVLAAIIGHILVYRRLRHEMTPRIGGNPPAQLAEYGSRA